MQEPSKWRPHEVKRSFLPRILLVALFALLAGAIAFLQWDTGARAERRVRRFLVAEKPSAQKYFDDYAWGSKRIGESSWSVWGGPRNIQPFLPERFLVNRKGTVHRVAAGPLSDILRDEFQPHVTYPDHEKFIEDFLKMLNNERFIRLQSVNDIPGYQNRPLPAEQAAKIEPPHRTAEGNQVIFTYQQIGGWVRRYEFHYVKGGSFQHVTESLLGHGIGDAQIYE